MILMIDVVVVDDDDDGNFDASSSTLHNHAGAQGQAEDIRVEASQIMRIRNNIVKMYSMMSGQTVEQVTLDLDRYDDNDGDDDGDDDNDDDACGEYVLDVSGASHFRWI